MGNDDDRREANVHEEDNAEISEGKHHVAAANMASSDMHEPGHVESTSTPELALELTRSSRLQVLSTPDKGRGVFARESIPADTLIEISPVLIVANEEYKENALNKTIFESYLFTWSRAGEYALALGLGSLFNHSSTSPNVSYTLDKVNHCIRYTTSRRIKENEELCIFYGHGVTFGEKGELLVDKAAPSDSEDTEGVETFLNALGGFGVDSEEEEDHSSEDSDSDDEEEEEEEGRLIPLTDIPLDLITGIVAPEDIPLETCESRKKCRSVVYRILTNFPCSQRLRTHFHSANVQQFP